MRITISAESFVSPARYQHGWHLKANKQGMAVEFRDGRKPHRIWALSRHDKYNIRICSGERMIGKVSGREKFVFFFYSPSSLCAERKNDLHSCLKDPMIYCCTLRDVQRAKTLSVCAHLACTLFRQTSVVPLPTTHRPLGRKRDWWESSNTTILSQTKENFIVETEETSISLPFIIRLPKADS